jgi:N-acetylglucosaminyldiphosphoundecaprenol N-acetyl-beta-D-mannosaminyltransferase
MNSLPSSPSHRKNIAGVPCDFISHDEFLEYVKNVLSHKEQRLAHIVTLNAEMVVEAQKNQEFRAILQNTDLNIPDGGSILWAREYLDSKTNLFVSLLKFIFSNQQPITGVDSILDICSILNKQNGTAVLIGGTGEERSGTKKVLEKKFPNLQIKALDSLEAKSYDLQANIAFVALGAPKQTFWIEQHREKLEQASITLAMGVGGAFSIISGRLPRAPKLLRRAHLEWLWRLFLEPKRIKRIWNAVVIFPKLISGYPH